MRKRRTSLEARLRVTLSFSAHSTGSLALVTSTARGSAAAGGVANSAARVSTAAASATLLPLPACGERVGVRGGPKDGRSFVLPLTLTLSPLRSGEREHGRCRQSAVQHTVDVTGVGLVRQACDVGGHLVPGGPASEREPLALAQRHVEAVAPERG